MIKNIGDNYKIYGLIIVKTIKTTLMLNYGLSNATFETPNHVFALTRFRFQDCCLIQHFGKFKGLTMVMEIRICHLMTLFKSLMHSSRLYML
jgi:hypothetical protein